MKPARPVGLTVGVLLAITLMTAGCAAMTSPLGHVPDWSPRSTREGVTTPRPGPEAGRQDARHVARAALGVVLDVSGSTRRIAVELS